MIDKRFPYINAESGSSKPGGGGSGSDDDDYLDPDWDPFK